MKLHGDIVLMIQPSEVRQKEALVHAELFFSESTAVHAIFKYIIRLSSRAWHIEAVLKAVVADNAAGGEEEVEAAGEGMHHILCGCNRPAGGSGKLFHVFREIRLFEMNGAVRAEGRQNAAGKVFLL